MECTTFQPQSGKQHVSESSSSLLTDTQLQNLHSTDPLLSFKSHRFHTLVLSMKVFVFALNVLYNH